MNKLLRLVALLAGLAGADAANALCTGVCACNVSTTSLVFGAVNPFVSTATTSTGNVRVSCGGIAGLLIPFSVSLSAGGSGSIAARKMTGGSQLLYNVYTSNTYTTVWGDGTGSSVVVNSGITLDVLGSSLSQDFPVYGRIPGSQTTIKPGIYTDALVVTLTYY